MNALPLPGWPAPALPSPNRGLRLAIAASVGLHVVALAWQHGALPALLDAPRPTLNVVLRRLAPPPVAPVPQAVVTPAATPTITPTVAPKRIPPPVRSIPPTPHPTPVITRKPAADTTPVRSTPAPLPAAAPVATAVAPASAAPAAQPVDTAPARPAAPALAQTPPAPAHAEAAPAPAAEATIDPAALDRYGRNLSNLFARQQNYPRLAALRGWEGEVQLRLTIARKGNIVATQVVRSSGFDVLDQSAIQLVSGAGPLPLPPDNLKNREFQVIVPVHYRLEKS